MCWVPECKVCGRMAERNSKHDAYYCTFCDTWIESACADQECEFCKDRPEHPSEAGW